MNPKVIKNIGYLSGAPRVSTNPAAENLAARSHVLGVMRGFEKAHWVVKPFIVGDRLPKIFSQKGSDKLTCKSILHRLLADMVRLFLRKRNIRQAWDELGGEVDWVYERFACMQAVGLPFKKKGIPWILETNALLFHEAGKERKALFLKRLARWLERKAYVDCDVLVCVTTALKKIIVKELGISENKILVMRNGVDTKLFDPVAYTPAKKDNTFLVGYVGSLTKWCRLDNLLGACSELRAEGYEIDVLVVGDGPAHREFVKLSKKLGLFSHVQFKGRVQPEEVPNYLATFNVAYCNSVHGSLGYRTYGSPIKLYEYMAMGKPVIAGEFEDTCSIIGNHKNGFLFKWDDPDALKQALLAAYQNRESLSEMGRLARGEIVRNHSWTSRVTMLIDGVEKTLRDGLVG